MSELVIWAGIVAAAVALNGLRYWLIRRRARLVRAGQADELVCRIRGDAPYPRQFRRARLHLSSGGLQVEFAKVRRDLAGLTMIRVRAGGTERWLQAGDVIVVLRAATGERLDIAVPGEQADIVIAAVKEGAGRHVDDTIAGPLNAVNAPLVRLMSRSFAVWIVVAMVVGAFWLWLFVASQRLDATVVTGDDGEQGCVVGWKDPWTGVDQSAEVDCPADTAAGERLEVWVLPAPFRGEAVDTAITPWVAGVSTAAPAAVALILVGLRVAGRRRMREAPVHRSATVLSLRELAPSELEYAEIVDVVTQRLVAERGEHATAKQPRHTAPGPKRRWRRWADVSHLRRRFARRSVGAVGAVVVVVLALWMGYAYWTTAIALRGEAEMTTATVVDSGDLLPSLWEVDVRFTDGRGRQIDTVVASTERFGNGATVDISYATASPARSRLVDNDGLRWAVAITATAALAGLAIALRFLLRALSEVRVLFAAWSKGRTTRVQYVIVPDVDGSDVVLLFGSAGGDAQWAVPAAGALAEFEPSGAALAHGQLSSDQPVVLELPQGVIWPVGPVIEAVPELVLELVNGYVNVLGESEDYVDDGE